MKNVEVLVACMNQNDDSLFEKMNLQSSAVLANQCDEYSLKNIWKGSNKISLVSTNDRGVGKNRNTTILNSSGDYLVFADEDMVFKDGYVETITNAFANKPRADIIFFELIFLNNLKKERKPNDKMKRVHIYNSLRYGAAGMTIKKESLHKSNVWFSLLYGGGAPFSSGEDSLFIREALKKGLKLYACPAVISDVKQESSTWFQGYNEKYFIDKGIFLANAFPLVKYFLALYYGVKWKKVTNEFTAAEIVKMIIKGIRLFDKNYLYN